MSDLASGGGIGFVCNASNFSNSIKLIYVLIQGFLLASYTFGLHLPGGVLMPSLALGATAGRVIGIISQSIQNGLGWGFSEECTKSSCLVSPSSYAVVGAASFMSGITKLTMCVVVIIFEQTGAISYVLPIMIAVMILKLVNDWLCNDNIYDQWLKREFNKYAKMNVVEDADIPVTNSGKGSGLCSYINATSVVKNNLPDITTLRIMVPLSQIKCIEIVKLLYTISKVREEFIRGNNHEGFPVIGSYQNPVVFGYITKQSLDNAISNYSEEQEFTFALSGGKVLPRSVISDQLRLQQDTQQVRIDDVIVSIDVEMSPIVLNEKTPIVTLLEMFEKLHLNYGIILRCIQKKDQNESIDQLMSGFIDRYLLADLINNNFTSLKDEYVIGSEYDIESMMDSDRQSAELLT